MDAGLLAESEYDSTNSRLCKTNKGAHTAIIGGRDRIILTQPAVELQEINL
jgi:hypothetical protein